MEKDYTNWVFHGEPECLSSDNDDESGSGSGSRSEGLDDMFEDFELARGNLETNVRDDESDDEEVETFPDLNEGHPDSFYKLWNDARLPLYPGCKNFSKLGFLLKLLHAKITNRSSNKAFNVNLEIIKASLPEGETLPESYYECKVLLRSLGLGYIPIDACKYDCALFWKENENLIRCPVCEEPRYKNPDAKGKKIPQKVLRYFPLKTRLQRLYMSRMTAKDMRWHKEKRVDQKNIFTHPADSQAWTEFDKEYGWFASDPRNVRLGLATDGFNPYGDMSSTYSMWPVMVVPYNMPPWKCMKDPFIFMSLLIPGPKAPGNDIDVFLRPLVDELKELWEVGVKTFDAVTKAPFQLHAAVIWTINDFPAYGNLSGWSTKGKLACPTCNKDTTSMYLKIGRKLCYMNHARFLQPRHSLRKRANRLFGHLKWSSVRPNDLSGDEVLEQISRCLNQIRFGKNPKHPKRKRAEKELNWSKISIFWELPYWPKLKIRHNLDVMHIEKNICESVLGTILKLDGKTKDTVKARMDLQLMGIRPELHLIQKPNNKYLVPQASYTLSSAERKTFCEWLKVVKFPDGFASNISRCVNIKDYKISGMKSHDCHVLLQRLLPAALRGFLADDIALALIELGFFFKELCCKTLKMEVLEKMEKDIAVILCKLEQIFPPAFFDVMVHLAVHLPREAILGGPVQYRWMYPIERFLRTLKQYVRNKTHPEGSIAEGYIDNECVTFCSMYLQGIETRFNRPDRNFDGDSGRERSSLEVFAQNVRPLGASKNCEISLDDYTKAEFFVLNNSEEISSFLEQHKEELKQRNPRASGKVIDKMHEQSFASWFLDHVQRLRTAGDPIATDDLFALACRPDHRIRRYSGCIVNGIRFHTKDRETNLRTQNSGVVVKGQHNSHEIDFFGVLKDIIQLEYVGNNHVYLFRCDWWDVGNKKTGIDFDQHFTSVNVSNKWYEDDQFVLASQVSQIFYVSDTKKKGTWQVVQRIEPRNIYSVLEKEEDEETEVVHDCGIYQEEMLIVNDIQDREIEVDVLHRVDVIPDEVDASTIMKNMETVQEEEFLAAIENIEIEDDTMINYHSEEEEGHESVTEGLERVTLIEEESDLEE